MKTILKLSIIIYFMLCFSSCANNEKVRDNIFQGVYEGSNRLQEMKSENGSPLPKGDPPSYEQYKEERQKMLKTDRPQ